MLALSKCWIPEGIKYSKCLPWVSLFTHVCLYIGHMIPSNTSQYLQYRNVSKI